MLIKKLKLKPGHNTLLINAPDNYFSIIGEARDIDFSSINKGSYDQVHLFVKNKADLDKYYKEAISAVRNEGLLWVAYPKKTSGMVSDLTRDSGWEPLMNYPGLQWNTLISLDNIWSAFALKKTDKPTRVKQDKEIDTVVNRLINMKTREIHVPSELQLLFNKNKEAEAFFNSLSFTNRKEYVIWIVSAKQKETKEKRLEQTISKLKDKLKNPTAKK